MVRRTPPLNALRAFEAAARHSSFSEAGKELSVAHTSVARHVRNLEDWLGIALFRKSGRNVILTEAGQKYFIETSDIFEQIEKSAYKLGSQERVSVKLSLEPAFAQQWFAKRFFSQDWGAKTEGFELDIISTSELSDLDKGEADLAVRYTRDINGGFDGDLIAKQTAYPFVAPSIIAASPGKSNLEILQGQKLLYAHVPERWDLWFEKIGIPAPTSPGLYKLDDMRLMFLAAQSGNGALIIPPEVVQDEVEKGLLVKISDIGLDHGAMVLLTAKASMARPEVQKARKFLLGLLDSFPKEIKSDR